MFCVAEGAGVELSIAIEVPQISSAAETSPVAPDQAAGEDIAIEVPQIEVIPSPSASDAGPPTQPSGQALSDTLLLGQKEEDEEEEEEEDEEEEEIEEERQEEEEDDDDVDDDNGEDDDERDRKAKVPAKDEPDDQTGLLPEYMIAESVPDLPIVDG